MERRYLFEYNGVTYERGVKIIMKHDDTTVEAFFNCRLVDVSRIEIYYNDMSLCSMPENIFNEKIVAITNVIDSRFKQFDLKNIKLTLKDELNYIDGMLTAWMWYIILMITWTIFEDKIGLWIFTTYVFIKYRNSKLIEFGYKQK